MIDKNKIAQLSDEEKVKLAHKATDDYIAAMQRLTKKQREIFIKGLNRLQQDEINKVHEELNNL